MSKEYLKLKEAFDSIKEKIPYKPDIALVLGSGLGDFAEKYKIDCIIKFDEVKNLPVSTVVGHNGRFVFFKINDKKIVCMQGRVHMYEGYTPKEVVRPQRLMSMMGAKQIILTNASGGIRDDLYAGDIMIINDLISLFVESPLIGENIDEFGVRFPDVCNLFNADLIKNIKEVAKDQNIEIKEGNYCQLRGPHFETKIDIQVLKRLGVDTVAMSLGIEAIAMHHMGVKILGISLIANKAAGIEEKELTHEDIKDVANKSSEKLKVLLENYIIK